VDRLKVALVGLVGEGADFLSVIRSDERFELVAVGDRDPEQLRSVGEELQVRGFEDYRSLIVESAHAGLDVVFVALEPFESLGLVELAAQRDVGVFHKAPVARNVREMRGLMERFEKNRYPLVVSRSWLFEPAFSALCSLGESSSRIYGTAATSLTTETPTGWRGDSVRAGGGTLLNGAYAVVDMLVRLLGLPEAVYAQCTMRPASGFTGKYDTEDVAILSLNFGEGKAGSVVARRGAAHRSWAVTLFGSENCFEVTPKSLTVTPCDGTPVQRYVVESDCPVASAIRAYGASCTSGDVPFESTIDQHLATVATIECAYLSARTGAPESPSRLLG